MHIKICLPICSNYLTIKYHLLLRKSKFANLLFIYHLPLDTFHLKFIKSLLWDFASKVVLYPPPSFSANSSNKNISTPAISSTDIDKVDQLYEAFLNFGLLSFQSVEIGQIKSDIWQCCKTETYAECWMLNDFCQSSGLFVGQESINLKAI